MKCEQCGQCCKKLSPTLTLEDLRREPKLWQYAVPIDKVGNAKMRRYMMEKNIPYVMNKAGRGLSCPFQMPNGLCGIHETRPQICRDYPQQSKCIKEMQCLLLEK